MVEELLRYLSKEELVEVVLDLRRLCRVDDRALLSSIVYALRKREKRAGEVVRGCEAWRRGRSGC